MDSVLLSLYQSLAAFLTRSWQASGLRRILLSAGANLTRWYGGSGIIRPLLSDWRERQAWQRSRLATLVAPVSRLWQRMLTGCGTAVGRWLPHSVLATRAERVVDTFEMQPLPMIGQFLATGGIVAGGLSFAMGGASTVRLAIYAAAVVVGLLAQLVVAPLMGLVAGSWLCRTVARSFGITVDPSEAPTRSRRVISPEALISGALLGLGLAVLPGLLAAKLLVALIGAYLVLRRPWLGMVAIALGLPFVSTKIMTALVVWVFVAWLADGAVNGGVKFRPDPLFIPATLFLIAAVLSTLTSLSVRSSLMSLVLYTAYYLVYLLASQLLRDGQRQRIVLAVLLLAGLATSLLGLYQYVAGVKTSLIWVDATQQPGLGTRVYGSLGNPNVLAEYLTLLVPLAVGLFWSARDWWSRLIQAGLALVLFACLALTFSRGAYLGIALAALVFALLVAPALLLLGAVLVLLAPLILPDQIMQRIGTIGSLQDSSNAYRLSIWMGTLRLLKDFWLPGVGLGATAFGLAYARYRVAGAVAFHSHNVILQLASELGIIGLLAFAWLLLNVVKHGVITMRATRDALSRTLVAGAVSGVAGHLLHGMVENVWFDPRIVFLFWLVLGLAFTVSAPRSANGEDAA